MSRTSIRQNQRKPKKLEKLDRRRTGEMISEVREMRNEVRQFRIDSYDDMCASAVVLVAVVLVAVALTVEEVTSDPTRVDMGVVMDV